LKEHYTCYTSYSIKNFLEKLKLNLLKNTPNIISKSWKCILRGLEFLDVI